MYVTRLDADDWSTGGQQDEVIENPELARIDGVLRRLDGERYTLVVLGAGENTYMGIGGGAGGKYVVFVNYDDQAFYSLKDPDPSISVDDVHALTIGGRQDEHPASQCVDRDAMLRAGLCFATDGTREPSLAWERQEEDEALEHREGASKAEDAE
jgi:hypothetical protein